MTSLRWFVVPGAVASLMTGLLARAPLAHAQATPAPQLPNDLDMSSRSPAIAHTTGGDSAALARFRVEYETSKSAPRPVFDKYLPILGPAKLLNFLEGRYPACHTQAHDLGRALFAATRDIEVALRECGTTCTSGCMHGAVSEAFATESPEKIAADMNAFCASGEMTRLHKPGNCAHGLGHALMFVTHDHVRRSIDACLGFSNQPMQYYCATGVYMAKFLTDRANGVEPSSAYAPCDRASLFPAACYRYQGAVRLEKLGDRGRLMLECSRLAGLQRRGCFHGLGYASIGAVFYDPKAIATSCGAGGHDDRVVCIEGAIEKLADLDEGRAKAACAFLDGEMRLVCTQSAQRKMYGLNKPAFGLYYDNDAIAQRRDAIVESAE